MSRLKKECLLELRSSYRSTKGDGSHLPQMTVWDMIIVEDDKTPRGFWRFGVITELLIGRDGEARAASVKTHGKDVKITIIRRPLQWLLIPTRGPKFRLEPSTAAL